jgi:hypothetical protein
MTIETLGNFAHADLANRIRHTLLPATSEYLPKLLATACLTPAIPTSAS